MSENKSVLVEKVVVPNGVEFEVLNGKGVLFKGFGREASRSFKSSNVFLKKLEDGVGVFVNSDKRNVLAEAKTIASHLKNLLIGLEKEFVCKLEIVYSHFPMNVSVKDGFVEISNICGAKHPKRASILGDTKVEVKGKEVIVRGHNKEFVGQTAANIEQATRIKGRDVRVFQDGIYIVSKVSVE